MKPHHGEDGDDPGREKQHAGEGAQVPVSVVNDADLFLPVFPVVKAFLE
jgi:hypothetical protein